MTIGSVIFGPAPEAKMSIGGISLGSIVLFLVVLYIGMRWGSVVFSKVGLA